MTRGHSKFRGRSKTDNVKDKNDERRTNPQTLHRELKMYLHRQKLVLTLCDLFLKSLHAHLSGATVIIISVDTIPLITSINSYRS